MKNEREREKELFHEALADCGLVDLRFLGSPFTWDNKLRKDDNIRQRLDRFCVNVAWVRWWVLFLYIMVFEIVLIIVMLSSVVLFSCSSSSAKKNVQI